MFEFPFELRTLYVEYDEGNRHLMPDLRYIVKFKTNTLSNLNIAFPKRIKNSKRGLTKKFPNLSTR